MRTKIILIIRTRNVMYPFNDLSNKKIINSNEGIINNY